MRFNVISIIMIVLSAYMDMFSFLAEEKMDMQLEFKELQIFRSNLSWWISHMYDTIENSCPDRASYVYLTFRLSTYKIIHKNNSKLYILIRKNQKKRGERGCGEGEAVTATMATAALLKKKRRSLLIEGYH